MNIEEYKYLWTSEKEDWVLVRTEYGYCIINKKTHMSLIISDEELENILILKMCDAGNRVYANINDAYNDVDRR